MTKVLAKKYGGNQNQANGEGTEAKPEAKPAMASASSNMVGSINCDKAVILGEEFDLLFGYDEKAVAKAEPKADSGHSTNTLGQEDVGDLLRQATEEGGGVDREQTPTFERCGLL